jgi:hypothetical protein
LQPRFQRVDACQDLGRSLSLGLRRLGGGAHAGHREGEGDSGREAERAKAA